MKFLGWNKSEKKKKKWNGKVKKKAVRIILPPLDIDRKSLEVVEEIFSVPDKVYVKMANSILKESSVEIAGRGLLVDDVLAWVCLDETISSHSSEVISDDGLSTAQCVIDNGVPPNLQWHTQPRMGVFFSRSDDEDQQSHMDQCMKFARNGRYYFVVIDGMTWNGVGYEWADGELAKKIKLSFVTEARTKMNFLRTRKYTSHPYRSYYPPVTVPASDPVADWEELYGENYDYYGNVSNSGLQRLDSVCIGDDAISWVAENVPTGVGGDTQYYPLFDLVGVRRGDWLDLIEVIEVYYPSESLFIIQNRSFWKHEYFLLQANEVQK